MQSEFRQGAVQYQLRVLVSAAFWIQAPSVYPFIIGVIPTDENLIGQRGFEQGRQCAFADV